MSLFHLKILAQTMELVENQNLKPEGKPIPPEDFETVGPAVTLFLAGVTVSGQLIGPRTYLSRMRKLVEDSGTEGSKSLYGIVFQDLPPLPEEAENEKDTGNVPLPETLFLQNVRVLAGGTVVNVDAGPHKGRLSEMAVDISSVQGWVFGLDLR